MNVLVAAASSTAQISGVQRHAFNLVRILLSHSGISVVHLVVAPWQGALASQAFPAPDPRLKIHLANMQRGALDRNCWYYFRLPTLAVHLGADLVHLSYPVPIRARAFSCPTVVTLHDMYPYEIPSNFGFPRVLLNRFFLRQCLEAVEAIACVSDVTSLRLVQFLPEIPWRKSMQIPNCVEAQPQTTAEAPRSLAGQRFLLCIAQHRKNKNIHLLLTVFCRLLREGRLPPETRLAIVGIGGPETRALHDTVNKSGLQQSVFFLQGLSETELQWCYGHCDTLLAPSMTEGFGLPVAEALLAGCRIVCSDIPAFRELNVLSGGRCRFFSLGKHEQQAFADAILASLEEPRPAPVALPALSATVLAGEYMEMYRALIHSTSPARCAIAFAAVHEPAHERQIL